MPEALPTVTHLANGRRRRRVLAVSGAVAVTAAAAVAVTFVSAPGGSATSAASISTPSAASSHLPVDIPIPTNPHTAEASFFPPSNGPGQVAITQAQAVASAQAQAVSAAGDPLLNTEQAALSTFSRLMSYQEAVALTGDGADPRIDPARRVWVVTVHGHHLVDTLPGSTASPVTDRYTIVTDAATGYLILGAFGVASLTS